MPKGRYTSGVASIVWRTGIALDNPLELINAAIDQMDTTTKYDDIRTCRLISTIKVLDKAILLIRFKDGTDLQLQVKTFDYNGAVFFTAPFF